MKIFAKSRTISLLVGLVLLTLILPGAVSAASTSSLNAQVISTTIPSSMSAGQSYLVSVTMKNTGSMTWNEGSMIRLGASTDGSGDASKFAPDRIKIPSGTNVPAGAQYTFSFTMTAPATPGYYSPRYKMVWEGHEWFGSRVTRSVHVIAPATVVPVAQFTASTTSGKAPLTVQFTDQSTGTPQSWAWDFTNDKKIESTVKSPSFTYANAGTYTVNLTVTNANGKDSEIKTRYITVSAPVVQPTVTPAVSGSVAPKAQFTSDATQGTASPFTVQFTDQSTGTAPLTYHWDFSDGAGNLPENSQKNPLWRFWEDAGTSFTVTLTVTNAYGSDTIVKQNYITFGTTPSAAPVAAFTSSVQSGTAPLTVQFTDQSTGTPQSYAWDFNNDKTIDSTAKSPSFTYATAGTYTVNLSVANANGKDSEIKTGYITVSAAGTNSVPTPTPTPITVPAKLPAAQFTASATSGQAPLTVQFTDQSVSAGTSSYAWDVNNDGTTEYTTKSPSHTYTAAGTYTVKLVVTNASGSDSEIKTGYITATSSPVIAGTGDFGYTSNPTGNPIGGGAGYTRILSETSAGVTYVVSTKAELLTALKSAKAGETVFVKGTAVIDMTGTPSTTIPAGVTLASDRGLAGSAGGLLKRTKNLNGGWEEPMVIVGGDNVRVTGLRLEGEMYPQDYGNNDVYPGSINERYYLVGISAQNTKGFEVDNCELYGWAWSTISLRQNSAAPIPYIHHNYIHHNQARGEGYGVNLYGGNALIEANLFDYNRHDVTGAGMSGEQYEARYNHHLGHGNAIGATNYDVHQDEETGTGLAGTLFKIHHNTIDGGIIAMLQVRGMPKTGMYVYNNVINSVASDTGVTGNKPIFQTSAGTGNMFVTQNYWKGTLYPTDNGIVVYY
jgi:PKD repeat protein